MPLPTQTESKQLLADLEWVTLAELDGRLIRSPQPESRQPKNSSTTWLDLAIRDLERIIILSDRTLVLYPASGNPVAARIVPDFFRYVRDSGGFTVFIRFVGLPNFQFRVRCGERPVKVAHRRDRWELRNVRKVRVTDFVSWPDGYDLLDRDAGDEHDE